MIDTYLRSSYQTLCVDPVARLCYRLKPAVVTLSALFFGLAAVPCIAFEHPFFAVAFLLLSGYCDTLDGTLARQREQASRQGAVLDIVCDRMVEWGVILALFLYAPEERGLLCLLMLGAVLVCITSFLVVGIFSENESEKGFHYSTGIVERTEAFAFFIAMILLPSLFLPLSILFTVLVFTTAVVRIYQFYFY